VSIILSQAQAVTPSRNWKGESLIKSGDYLRVSGPNKAKGFTYYNLTKTLTIEEGATFEIWDGAIFTVQPNVVINNKGTLRIWGGAYT
jgi:hypothetical protein